MFKERYVMRNEMYYYGYYDTEDEPPNLDDGTIIDIQRDFNLEDHPTYADCTPCGIFPPMMEEIVHTEALDEQHNWILSHGKIKETWQGKDTIEFDQNASEAIFKDMKKNDFGAIHCPELKRIFLNAYMF